MALCVLMMQIKGKFQLGEEQAVIPMRYPLIDLPANPLIDLPPLVSICMSMMSTFACFECFRRSAPLIRRALRTSPLRESTLSPSAAAQISPFLLLGPTACQGEGGERACGRRMRAEAAGIVI
jgi:hypothetical protein